MSSFKITQISDTHLSRRRPYFVKNWQAAERHINETKPDLVIHTGDVSLDGAGFSDDMAYSLDCMQSLGVPWLILPGNHDMGEAPCGSSQADVQPADDARRRLWLDTFGPDYWKEAFQGWRLIGMNTQLFDTGLEEEENQWRFLDDALAEGNGQRTLLFLHKPFYLPGFKDENSPRRYLQGRASRRLFESLEDQPIRLMASGHVHQALDMKLGDMAIVWAPTTAFVLNDELQPPVGEKFCGIVEYVISGDDIAVEFVTPEGMETHDMLDYADMYKELRAASKK